MDTEEKQNFEIWTHHLGLFFFYHNFLTGEDMQFIKTETLSTNEPNSYYAAEVRPLCKATEVWEDEESVKTKKK